MVNKSFSLFLLFFFSLLNVTNIFGQNTIAFQGFEGTATDNWGFTSPSQAAGPGQVTVGAGNYGAGYAKTGNFSMRAGGGSTACASGSSNCVNGAGSGSACNNLPNGKIVEFNAINIACLSGVQISVSHRSHVFCTGQGEGFDAGENLLFEVSLNGGPWTTVGTLGGSGNYVWLYSTTPAGIGLTVANPFIYNVPAGTNSVAFRTNCNVNRADEVYYIDDVKITTSTVGYNFPGTAGLWNGNVNTDWTNACNWDDRNLPTVTTDVYIPNGAINICEVLPSKTGNCHNLLIDKSKLAAEYFTSTLNVTGNLVIDNNGELDMSLNGNEGGTLNLNGNWLNKRDESFFEEEKSTVNFIGNANQSFAIINDTKECFYKMGINKVSGILLANTNIWIDQTITGGISNLLTLSNGLFDLNTHSLTIWNSNFQSILRTGGGIISEQTDNSSNIVWKMNSNTGSYIFPFARRDGTYIPFTFNHTTGNAGEVTLATYGTPPDNLPWPTTPDLVTNLNSAIGLTPDNRDATVDRFWQIIVSGTAQADLTFTYASSELPVAPYNNPGSLQAQRFNSNQWLPYPSGQTAGSFFVTVLNVNSFSPWTLTNSGAPLPIELLNFNAIRDGKNVDVTWTTASEINNNYFTVLRSRDGLHFEEIGQMNGAGNSTATLSYEFTDIKPWSGISYYQLKQTDFDDQFSYSKIVAVNIQSSSFGIDFINEGQANNLNILINTPHSSPLKVEVLDLLGKIIISNNYIPENKPLSVSLNSSGLTSGIYIIKISDDSNEVIKKVVIN